MKKFKIVLFLSAMMAISVGGFVKSQQYFNHSLQSIEQMISLNTAKADCEMNGWIGSITYEVYFFSHCS